MLGTLRECRDFHRCLQETRRRHADRRDRAHHEAELFDDLTTVYRNEDPGWSMRNLFEVFVEDGQEILREMDDRRRSRGQSVLYEAEGAVNTADFANVIGQINYSFVLQALDEVAFIGDQLFTVQPATTESEYIAPGVTRIGDQGAAVGEQEAYPYVKVGEEFVTLPRLDKQGFMIAATEEILLEDKTALVEQRMREASQQLGITREKDRLSVALGITTTYSRNNGPKQATYANSHTQGDFDNLVASNALVDYTSVDSALNALANITDPDTGEPVAVPNGLQLVHPFQLRSAGFRVLEAESIVQGAISATVPRTVSGNPLLGPNREVISPLQNQYVSTVGGSSTSWWLGNFRGAFVEREQIAMGVQVEDRNNSPVAFERDIILRLKVRYKSKPGVMRPQLVVRCDA